MKKKNLILAALAGIALAGCSDDALVEETVVNVPNQDIPILFMSNKGAATRANATGAEAAALLGAKFVVSGYKGASSATVGNVVFDNYLVSWGENTANTTESNSSNWEYVGQPRIKHAIDNGITSQTIKYWDYSKAQYDFIAWSTGTSTAIYEGTPADGEVLVTAIKPNTATTAAYTFSGLAKDLQNCYIADLVTVKKAQYGDTPVTLTFRSLGSKVRIGIYETIPGYSVKDVQFYSAAASNDAQAAVPKLFTTVANNIYTKGVYTVYYPTVDNAASADNNKAHVSFVGSGDQSTVVQFGALNLTIAEEGEHSTGNVFIGRSSNEASFAGEAEGNYYTAYLPNEGGTNLNLRVNYTLESIDGSGEVIEVKGATAQVPSIYTQWKAGFAYTYIFKISDKTNGHTGVYDPTRPDDTTVNSDPAGLYPITFDAVVVNDEDADKTQETITLVSTPSITTYQKGSSVVNNNEYTVNGNDIYVTVSENDALATLTGKAALYTLPAGKTEADVVDALAMQDDDAAAGTIKGRSGLVLTNATLTLTNKVEYGVDGNTINVAADQAAKFAPAAATTYAFVYTKTAPTTTTDMFQPVTKAVNADVAGLYRFDYIAATVGDAQKGVKYFTKAGDIYTLKTPFIGQTVNNLYLNATGTTIASGYAVTGTTYYYTVNHGQSYKAAHNVAYADFATAELYTLSGGVYTAKTETTPANGVAYYYKESDSSYTYCVILPEQTTGWYELDEAAAKVACAAGEKAINGQTYFDKYVQNNGVYYTKVIKVQ